ncbi:UNVERIFIED_ORG: hypothetical protein ABIC62_005834 [Burkholderia sp. 1595]|uniref:Uncharacterized protein n=1 Tax=Paraburkholderia terricola TaxID=169427 RepID=A0ABU1M043_9BURK|nr:hypothetical protein [Paraburkholderia terricola]MDR6481176.1 hypothetical protein [Paraburkholderia terricola]
MSTSLSVTPSGISVERYMRWLEKAVSTQTGTSEGTLVSLLREAGAPMADSEAIAAGVSNLRAATSRADRARQFIAKARLDNHGGSFKTELLHGRKTRRGIRRWILVGLLGLCSAVVVIGVYSVYRHIVAFDINAATGQQQHIVAKPTRTPSDVSPPHLKAHSHAAGAKSGTAIPGTDVKHQESARKRPSSLLASGDIPMTGAASPSFSPQPTSHPESCPPGVDRLGCPGAATSPPSSAGLIVPPHAHYEATGFGWECNAGYVQKEGACSPMHVPAHAHLDVSGHGWFCDIGFAPNNETCLPTPTGTPE